MQNPPRIISRDPFESDKRVPPLWWLEEDCNYCIRKDSKYCEHCIYNKTRSVIYSAYD